MGDPLNLFPHSEEVYSQARNQLEKKYLDPAAVRS